MRMSILLLFVILLPLPFLGSCGTLHDVNYTAHVWEDLNGNGQEDAGERPLVGVVVQLADSSGRLWTRVQTDEQGNINEFSAGGTCGEYAIYLSVPDGYWPTTAVMVKTPRCERANFGLRPYP